MTPPLPYSIISWITTIPFLVIFALLFLFFHPLFVLSHLINPHLYKLVVDISNLCLLINLKLVGARIKVRFTAPLPHSSLIFVSNHQSLFDIPLLIWTLRAHHPKFIAKIELGKGIPSLSHALKYMGSVLIKRDSPSQALLAIKEFGKCVQEKNHSAVIFPEGTRAKDGKMKRFKHSGLVTLLKAMPRALVVPISIQGSWKINQHKMLPVPFGAEVRVIVFAPIERTINDEELAGQVEEMLRNTS